jgi:hypothetical protein
MTCKELVDECKRRNIKGYSRLKKDDLLRLIDTNNIPQPNKKGSLKKFGYTLKATDKVRHQALKKAIEERGKKVVRARIQLIHNLTGNKTEAKRKNQAKYQKDLNWIDKQK